MKTVLITGAGSGVGKALNRVFADNGWETIPVSHRDLEITVQTSLQKLAGKLQGRPVDVLVNCAGVYDGPADGEATAITVEEIARVFQVNTIGPKILADLLVPNLLKGKERLVVTVSSIMSLFAKLDDYSAQHWSYGASKMAVNYAMIAFNIAHPEIKSVLVHPGWVRTKMGGKDAEISPEESAAGIFKLIQNHQSVMPNRKLVDYRGNLIQI